MLQIARFYHKGKLYLLLGFRPSSLPPSVLRNFYPDFQLDFWNQYRDFLNYNLTSAKIIVSSWANLSGKLTS